MDHHSSDEGYNRHKALVLKTTAEKLWALWPKQISTEAA
jgi:hypothetical protein